MKFLRFLFTALLFCFLCAGAFAADADHDSKIKKSDIYFSLENTKLWQVRQAEADVVVLHYSKDGTGKEPFTREEIESLQEHGKTVLAYLPLTTAYQFEFYWNPAWETATEQVPCYETNYVAKRKSFEWERCDEDKKPAWLAEYDPEAHGYLVKFWQQEWWEVALAPYLAKIEKAGFDGVYIDIQGVQRFLQTDSKNHYSRVFLARELLRMIGRVFTKQPLLAVESDFAFERYLNREEHKKLSLYLEKAKHSFF